MQPLLVDNWITWDQLQLVVVYCPIIKILNQWSRYVEIWTQHATQRAHLLTYPGPWTWDASQSMFICKKGLSWYCSGKRRWVLSLLAHLVQLYDSHPKYLHDGELVLRALWNGSSSIWCALVNFTNWGTDWSTNIMALTVQKLDMETDAAMFAPKGVPKGVICSLRIMLGFHNSRQYQQFSWKEAGKYLCLAFKSCDGAFYFWT